MRHWNSTYTSNLKPSCGSALSQALTQEDATQTDEQIAVRWRDKRTIKLDTPMHVLALYSKISQATCVREIRTNIMGVPNFGTLISSRSRNEKVKSELLANVLEGHSNCRTGW